MLNWHDMRQFNTGIWFGALFMESLKHKKKVVGIKETKNAVKSGTASVVYLAEDADFQVIEPLREFCTLSGIKYVSVPGRKELSKACGVDVPTAAAAVLED